MVTMNFFLFKYEICYSYKCLGSKSEKKCSSLVFILFYKSAFNIRLSKSKLVLITSKRHWEKIVLFNNIAIILGSFPELYGLKSDTFSKNSWTGQSTAGKENLIQDYCNRGRDWIQLSWNKR